jgi:hypothetical protein
MIKSIEIIKPDLEVDPTQDPKVVELHVVVEFEPNYKKISDLRNLEFDKPEPEMNIGSVDALYEPGHTEDIYNDTIEVVFGELDREVEVTIFKVGHRLYKDNNYEEEEEEAPHTWPKP